jgi:hypothetical protein
MVFNGVVIEMNNALTNMQIEVCLEGHTSAWQRFDLLPGTAEERF